MLKVNRDWGLVDYNYASLLPIHHFSSTSHINYESIYVCSVGVGSMPMNQYMCAQLVWEVYAG